MIRRLALLLVAVLLAGAGASVWTLAGAQEDESAERSTFVSFVEDRISTPDRRIRLGRIEGALSSDVRISSITISDTDGVWLTINDAHLVWSRLALLRGRLDIDLLEAGSIEMTRQPGSAGGAPAPASREPFALPELPVEVRIARLAVPAVALAAPVLGEPATLSVDGSVNLAAGSLDTRLAIQRTDDRPGSLTLSAQYANEDRNLALDLVLEEPANGVLANALGIPDRPALRFEVAGTGPIDSFGARIALDAAGQRLVAGDVTVSAGDDGTRVLTDLSGTLAPLFPPEYAAWVSGTSQLVLDLSRAADGTVDLSRADVTSGVASLTISGRLAPDLFPTDLTVRGTLADPSGSPVPLPGAAGTASVASTRFDLSFGGADERWSGRFDLVDLTTATLTAGSATIEAGGSARDLRDPAKRSVTADLKGVVSGVAARDPALGSALGDRFDVALRADWSAGRPVAVEIAEVKNANAAVHFAGAVSGLTLDGRTWLNAADLAPFADLAGQPLSGALTFESRGTIALSTGAFDLVFDATGADLGIGNPTVDPLLAGESRLGGGVRRSPEGLAFEELHVATPAIEARIDGRYDFSAADLLVTAALADVAALTDRASGGIALEGTVRGSGLSPALDVAITADRLDLDGHAFTDGRIGFTGTLDSQTSGIDGDLTLAGILDRVAVDGRTRIATLADGTRRLEGLSVRSGPNSLSGDLAVAATGLIDGRIALNAPDVAAVAPLFLADAAGAVSADITLESRESRQAGTVIATAKGLRVGTAAIAEGTVDLTLGDLFGVPSADGRIRAAGVTAGGTTIRSLAVDAAHAAAVTRATLDADLAAGDIAAVVALRQAGGGFDVDVETLSLAGGRGLSASLARPVTVAVRNGSVAIPSASLKVGSGTVTVAGTAGDRLDLSIDVASLPLAVADAVRPDLGVSGTLSGTVRLTGAASDPVADIRAKASAVSLAALRDVGVPVLDVEATGKLAGGVLALDASGRGGGMTVDAGGRVPVGGAGALDLAVRGRVPLALGDRFLRERGGRLTGTAALDLRIGGSLSAPRVSGTIATDDGGVTDPETTTRLSGVSARIVLDGDVARIERLAGTLGRDGRIAGSGTIGIAPGSDFPADLSITLERARLTDGKIVAATVDGALTVTGPLLAGPRLAGEIRIARAEVTVPESLPGSVAFLDVGHRLPPPNVARTLERVRAATQVVDTSSGRGGELVLDVTVSAPSKVFVRGRGIDAELGGEVRVTGPVSDVRPIGALQMIRGRVSIIGQRITFDRGTLALVGDLDPVLDFTASTRANGITVTAQISGVASDPKIALTSVPELPQDEVLAQLLFGRSVSDLSPLQLASLAVAVAELAGAGGGPGLLDTLRKSTGLDDLEVVTDEKGNAAVQAGRYVSENVYLGVRAGANGETNVSVNLDLADGLKARAEVGPESGSTIGVFYETEY
jgi:translocation and assembly module TamB